MGEWLVHPLAVLGVDCSSQITTSQRCDLNFEFGCLTLSLNQNIPSQPIAVYHPYT